jgi:GNAT superfamily N-acetyltransferase
VNADELADLVERAIPGEGLTADDLLGVCFDDDEGATVVLGDETGAVSAAVRHGVGAVQLLCVAPDARGEGRGRWLLDEATAWAFDHGVDHVTIGAAPPWYLWPGIDLRWTAGLVLAESAGFQHVDVALNMSCPTSVRIESPAGVTIRRVVTDGDASAVVDLCRRAFAPAWRKEASRGIEHGACHGAFDESGALLGFAAHSVNRAGWFGPTGVDPERQRGGIGGPLISACLEDLMVAGFDHCEISWIGPVGFYAKAVQAEIGRAFRITAKRKP